MIKINKSTEPICLIELKAEPNVTYNDLVKPCKTTVQELLATDQNNLCAYCQYQFKSVVFIEHYIPQSIDANRQLDYDNFLGVCSGKYYLDRKSGKSIDFCSVLRGNQVLTINPENQVHIDTISYNEDFQICSNNPTFHNELSVILNLNFEEICNDREIAFEEELNWFINKAIELNLSKINLFSEAIASVIKRNPQFSGLLIYKFKEQLSYYEDRKIEDIL